MALDCYLKPKTALGQSQGFGCRYQESTTARWIPILDHARTWITDVGQGFTAMLHPATRQRWPPRCWPASSSSIALAEFLAEMRFQFRRETYRRPDPANIQGNQNSRS